MSSLNLQLLLLLAVCAQLFALGLTGVLYPYGTAHGDSLVPEGDDRYQLVTLAQPFRYYGVDHDELWVETNGLISFVQRTGSYKLEIPDDDYRFIGPYVIDLITEHCNGRVFYREVTSGPLLTTASNHVKQCNSGQSGFSANWVFVATWENLTYYHGDETTPIVTFQAVLISDGTKSFVMFNYKDIQFAWFRPNRPYSQMGFNKGDGVHYTVLPGTASASAANVELTTNCSPSGRWFFRVDGDDVEFGGIFPYGVYDCSNGPTNPCTPANAALMKFHFAYMDRTKFVQCSQWGQCYIKPCPGSLVFHPESSVCSWL